MSKSELEPFRVQQFAAPHPARLRVPSQQQLQASSAVEQPDEGRVVVHFDVRCDYWLL